MPNDIAAAGDHEPVTHGVAVAVALRAPIRQNLPPHTQVMRIRLLGANILIMLLLAASTGLSETAYARTPKPLKADPAASARARELIALAQAALGGENALRDVTSLSAAGHMRRYVKYVLVKSPTKIEEREKILKGKVVIEFLLPDKYRRLVSGSTLLDNKYSFTEVINGDRAWRVPPLIAMPSSKRGRHAIDVSDFERSLAYQADNARQHLTLYSLSWLLREPPNFPLTYTYKGRLRTDGAAADVIALEGGGDFHPWFILDPQNHLPSGFVSSFIAALADPILMERPPFNLAYLQGIEARARRERVTRARPPRRHEMMMHFSDHRRVNAILLPHRMTTKIDGKVVEELVISKYEINRRLNPKNFEPESPEKPKTRSGNTPKEPIPLRSAAVG